MLLLHLISLDLLDSSRLLLVHVLLLLHRILNQLIALHANCYLSYQMKLLHYLVLFLHFVVHF